MMTWYFLAPLCPYPAASLVGTIPGSVLSPWHSQEDHWGRMGHQGGKDARSQAQKSQRLMLGWGGGLKQGP